MGAFRQALVSLKDTLVDRAACWPALGQDGTAKLDTVTDIPWMDHEQKGEALVAAAKLHVLRLDPIKAKLGDKWGKLSGLVHKLFEKALRNVQGPSDHFLLIDEMSYVVTFNTLSLEAASLACASVAKEVCELLFGADVEDIAVRGLVALVPKSSLRDIAGGTIAEMLERRGGEIIVRPGPERHTATHEDRKMKIAVENPSTATEWITDAEELFAKNGMTVALFPIWDLKARKSASVHLAAFSPSSEKAPMSMRRLFRQAGDAHLVGHEIALLRAASAYAQQVHRAQKVCAVSVGVSYETLSGLHARIAYIGALKAIPATASCPILLRIERVPEGTPHGRLAEIVNMLAAPNVRPTVEFQSPRDLADLDIRLGAAGIGWTLPADCDGASARGWAAKLAQRAASQKAFSFVQGLKNNELLAAVQEAGVRFGAGSALGSPLCFGALDPVPHFPLGN
jgi:hypothetical protein